MIYKLMLKSGIYQISNQLQKGFHFINYRNNRLSVVINKIGIVPFTSPGIQIGIEIAKFLIHFSGCNKFLKKEGLNTIMGFCFKSFT